MAGFHDAAGGTGYHEPAALSHRTSEGDRLLVRRLVGTGASGAKNRDFAARAIGGEDFEGITQLAHRAAEDFQVPARRLVSRELVGRFLDLSDQVGDTVAVECLDGI